jgi:hypothetical protein
MSPAVEEFVFISGPDGSSVQKAADWIEANQLSFNVHTVVGDLFTLYVYAEPLAFHPWATRVNDDLVGYGSGTTRWPPAPWTGTEG